MATAILPPTGEPFAIVGTAEAKTAIEDFRLTATEMLDGADEVIDGDRGRVTAHTAALLAVLAHRDDLVAENARLRHGCKSARAMLRREDSDEINDAATFLDEALGVEVDRAGEAAAKPAPATSELWAFVVSDATGILMLEHAAELREHIDARGDVGDYLTAPAPGLWFWKGTAVWSGGTFNGHEGEGADLTLEGEWIATSVRNAIVGEHPCGFCGCQKFCAFSMVGHYDDAASKPCPECGCRLCGRAKVNAEPHPAGSPS